MNKINIGSLFQFIRNGMNIKQDKSGLGLPITRIETISEAVIDSTRVGYANLTEKEASSWFLENGDILFSHINSVQHIGKCAIYRGLPNPLVHGMNLLCFRCDQTKLYPEYAKYLLQSKQFRVQLSTCIKKAVNQASVSIRDIQDIVVVVPSLPEQQRIAKILDQADALRAKRLATLSMLDTLTQSLFLDMFGDPVLNTKNWPRKYINDIATVVTGNTPPRVNPQYYGDEIEWIKSDNINTPNYYLTRAEEGLSKLGCQIGRIVPAGSILVTCIAGSPECIGNSAMADRDVAFNQQINALIPNQGNAHFIYNQLQIGKKLIQQASTKGMKGIVSKSRFERIEIIWPPDTIQERFAKKVITIQEEIGKQRDSFRMFDELFTSLQHRSFNGVL
ncbi:restriction endonuclease subunit S [Methanospirillum sp. J.3.6.1-F.2.7.3]|uniref:Restriction endonuclease subunit S n=1 Tax=Methanospirillum purgamenti TaxID=2834276 RepID=A0A8E7AX45_9EURY|nr:MULTISPECIES: restriction endonuclease subunit S [Methanospirillum]MDX8551817.1 restriction endonuclease subunit S [Methanospirillum hungatei]QVV88390.1 restriction endonuclease subunit S [Methanospirillum sp. J.3.6.1-F.2.7.3]